MAMNPKLLRPRASGFSPRTISGLVAWFEADDATTFTLSGTSVSEWRDKSGNGYAVSQSTANNQPARTGTVGGRATVDFDGTNDYLFSDNTGLSTFFSGDKAMTVFCVGEMHNSSEMSLNTQGTWLSLGSTTSGTQFFYMRSDGASGNGQLQIRNDASNTSGTITGAEGPTGDGTADGTAKDAFIASATVPSQSTTVLRFHTTLAALGNGAARPIAGSSSTSAAARTSGNLTTNRFTIGALGRNTFADYFPARISEIILYSRALSDAERTRVVQLLGRKYTLSTPVL